MFLLFQTLGGLEKYIGESISILLVFVFLVFIYKIAPIWKDIKFREAEVRQKETEATVVLASGVTHLADAQTNLANTMNEIRRREAEVSGKLADSVHNLANAQTDFAKMVHSIAVEQRQSTEAVKILQRVNAKSNEQLASDVQGLNETLQSIDVAEFKETLQNVSDRLSRLENKDAGNQ